LWTRIDLPREAQMCCARGWHDRCQCLWGESAHEAGQTPNTKQSLRGLNDARTGMPHGIPRGAMCVQRFDDSLNSAIHTTYRISLRSSSMPEPRDPLLKVVNDLVVVRGVDATCKRVWEFLSAGGPAEETTIGTHSQGGSQGLSTTGDIVASDHLPGAAQGQVMILPQVHLRKPCYDFYFL
jgi:hypothetical protein